MKKILFSLLVLPLFLSPLLAKAQVFETLTEGEDAVLAEDSVDQVGIPLAPSESVDIDAVTSVEPAGGLIGDVDQVQIVVPPQPINTINENADLEPAAGLIGDVDQVQIVVPPVVIPVDQNEITPPVVVTSSSSSGGGGGSFVGNGRVLGASVDLKAMRELFAKLVERLSYLIRTNQLAGVLASLKNSPR